MTVADHIADQLFNIGVRRIFGIPGGPSIPYIEAFRKKGIEFILVSNEASAGIMADVTARLTGIPGVCHATFGPGATNISTGIGGALLDRSPVIVMTSEISDPMLKRTTQMNIDHQKLFAPLTKATFRLEADKAAGIMRRAIKICMEEYPGPVHVGLPSDIADCEVPISQSWDLPDDDTGIIRNDVDRVASLLSRSRRPIIAAGLTARRMGIHQKLLSFLDNYRIPVVLTPMAKGLIPGDHPSYAGVLFHALSDYMNELYERCDLIIGFGYDQVEYNYESWMPDVPLIHFDTIEVDLPSGSDVTRFTGLPGEWFTMLDHLDKANLVREERLLKGIRDEMLSVLNGFSASFGPVAALRILRETIPTDTIITADVGSHLHLLGQYWNCRKEQEFIITNGWSGMGFGIPAALAASMCKPRNRVVCITGDGGFLMMAGEILTARRYKLPVIFVVLCDGELNLIRLKQSWKEISPYGTILYDGDLFGSDTFLGIRVINADTESRMSEAVSFALSLNEPVVINAIIDPEDYKYLIVRQ